jgi:hypothetical protein
MSSDSVVGWDIGGVNTKIALVRRGAVLSAMQHPYEVQRRPDALGPLLRELAARIGASAGAPHAVTMTAELSQMFRTKREGVAFVLDAVTAVFGESAVRAYTVDGRFVSAGDARDAPLAVAASNWAATAHLVAIAHPDTILIDVGTTTTDIVPIVRGRVVAVGHTDPARLASGELVYTGVLRTPVEAIAHHVPLGRDLAGVSAEGFALAGDVHLWRGDLAAGDYTVPTPDGRPATREFTRERLARVVCADREMLDDAAISAIADALALAQVASLAGAIARVRAREPSLRSAVVTGLGAFLATAAARQAGLDVVSLADDLGAAGSRCAPAAAVALLLDRELGLRTPRVDRPTDVPHAQPSRVTPLPNERTAGIDAVIKVGGGLLAHAEHLSAVLAVLAAEAAHARFLIVPGGGPFADAVRTADRQYPLGDDAAHWMAVLAMDQYAHLLATRHPDLTLVDTRAGIDHALRAGRIPVLAPSRWLREADPLPHSWDVTSDSIAAWLAGAVGSPRLVLVKPPGARGDSMVDRHFAHALPNGVTPTIVSADDLARLESILSFQAQ